MRKKVTISTLLDKKGKEAITSVTAYDYTSAQILDSAGIDFILVGDSLGMVMQGMPNTVSVTVDEMIYHGKMVRRGIKYAFMAVDMPFGSYVSLEDGLINCIRVAKETGADAIKIEGADPVTLELIRRLLTAGVCVLGHIGLQPQQINVMGGFRVQRFSNSDKLLDEAQALENAGIKLLVLEGMESACAGRITESITIPTIGIGAGVRCDGQVLVYHDIFGLYSEMTPKFVKKYAETGGIIKAAAERYIEEVRSGVFPSDEYSY
ncbi:MAG: 3-methyl-2-oxobutanoate hydroxymethyltransferase [Deferribacteraceae bacterium]|jgi:3-methyl-2-oxobutanoate hydroxymethyltransferase|nr:3-methyl-2-oxobutanoate hydroxymethyltransferase [Deferribacteraceae bacterium]